MSNAALRLAALNPGGRDPDQDFPNFAGAPNEKIHAPVNYHGYAAATGGAFLRSVEAVRQREIRSVILLLRSDLKASLVALKQLQEHGCRVFISFKESGLHQVSQTLSKKGNPELFTQLCGFADGTISSTEDLVALYGGAGAKNLHFIPTPYPLGDSGWDFSIPPQERSGIFVGTREFDVPTRNHAMALAAAFALGREFSETVSVVNEDGRSGRKQIDSFAALTPGVKLNIIEGRRSYPEYLRNIARHRLVFQCDASAVPGQVAGDALLCGIPCVGGNGAVERLAFHEFTSHGRSLTEVVEVARRLLGDARFHEEATARAQKQAYDKVSFHAVREQLAALL